MDEDVDFRFCAFHKPFSDIPSFFPSNPQSLEPLYLIFLSYCLSVLSTSLFFAFFIFQLMDLSIIFTGMLATVFN